MFADILRQLQKKFNLLVRQSKNKPGRVPKIAQKPAAASGRGDWARVGDVDEVRCLDFHV